MGILASGSMGILGAVFSGFGSIVQGIAQANQLEAQAEIARAQAQQYEYIAENQKRNALLVSEQGQYEAWLQDRKNRALAGQQDAAMGASGVETSSPSFLQARAGLLKIAGEEAEGIVSTRQKESYNYRVDARVQEHNAAIQRAAAEAYEDAAGMALFSGFIGAASSIIGAIGSSPLGAASPSLAPFKGFTRPTITSVPIPKPRPFTIMRRA